MSMTDLLADMLTRIRNGQQARLVTIKCKYSKLCKDVLEVLKDEGYIDNYSESKDDNGFQELTVDLKYVNGEPVIRELKKESKSGRRIYSAIKDLKKFYNGLGVVIVSTSKGVMSDFEARRHNVGGEILCSIF